MFKKKLIKIEDYDVIARNRHVERILLLSMSMKIVYDTLESGNERVLKGDDHQERIDSILELYPTVEELPYKFVKVSCRNASFIYQRIKRMAEAGVPHAQETVDQLAVLFEDPLRYQLFKN